MKKKQKEPDFLCSWDFCSSCINYRIRMHLPLTDLKSYKDIESYFRIKHPEWKPSQPRLKK